MDELRKIVDALEDLQRKYLGHHCLDLIQQEIKRLAEMGIFAEVKVGPGPAPSTLVFPQMLYKPDGTFKIVANSDEASKARSEGFGDLKGA